MFINLRDRLVQYTQLRRSHKFIVLEIVHARKIQGHLSQTIFRKSGTRCVKYFLLLCDLERKIYLSILATRGLKHRPMSYRAIERKYRIAVLSDLCAILQMERFTLRHEWFRKKRLFFCRGKETESLAPPFVSSLREESNRHVSLRERIHRLIA